MSAPATLSARVIALGALRVGDHFRHRDLGLTGEVIATSDLGVTVALDQRRRSIVIHGQVKASKRERVRWSAGTTVERIR